MTMGDCGAFSYVREKDPPFTVEEVVAFYHDCGFDYGVSVDHIIMAYKPEWDEPAPPGEEAVPPEILERQKITLDLARDFLREHKRRNCRFTPVGVAQGWSPKSYAHSVEVLQDMGFERIAIGGLVPLKTKEILACLSATNEVRRPKTGFHLFGVTRTHEVSKFIDFGVVSFDSTSPLRQAFKDDKDNFWTLDRAPKTRLEELHGSARSPGRRQSVAQASNTSGRGQPRRSMSPREGVPPGLGKLRPGRAGV